MSLEQSRWFQLASCTLNAVLLTLFFSTIGISWTDTIAGYFLFFFCSMAMQKAIGAFVEVLLLLIVPVRGNRN
jgi:hypothetical protein